MNTRFIEITNHAVFKVVKVNALLAVAVLLCGCATKNGRCYPIVGFGWVTVNNNQATILKSSAIGLSTGVSQACLGFSSFTVISVPTNANVIIDLKQ